VKDHTTYSSAGATAGIDLALALLEEDRGQDVTREVAQSLVVYLQRAGGQSQFSATLRGPGPRTPLLRQPSGDLTAEVSASLQVDGPVSTLRSGCFAKSEFVGFLTTIEGHRHRGYPTLEP
jgi:transcriptional regulator GlxA family with amidase domain